MRFKDFIISANTGLDAIKRAPILDEDTGLKCIRIQDISQKKDFDEWGFTKTTENDFKKFKLKKDDILIARTGATVGVSYIVKEDINSVYNNGSIRLRFSDNANAYFMYYVMQSKSFLKYIDNVSCVATQPNLRIETLLRFTIPDIDLKFQNAIAYILSKYDELIEINNKRIKLLEQIVENYFKLFYENEIKNHQVNIVKLGKLLDITRGLSYSSEEIECDDGITLINLKNIQGFGGFRRDGNKCYNGDYKEAQVVKQGDLVMGVTDMTQDRRTVGSVALIPDIAGVSVISADLIKIETDINKSFLYCLFRFGNVSKYISQFANGANVLHLKPEVIKKVKVMMPTQEYIKAFCRIVTPILDEIEMLHQQNDNLIKQRDLLLPRLMSGKLSVETKTKSVPKVKKVISFDDFRSNMGMAARAKTISDKDLIAMYEAYIDDNATE